MQVCALSASSDFNNASAAPRAENDSENQVLFVSLHTHFAVCIPLADLLPPHFALWVKLSPYLLNEWISVQLKMLFLR